LEIKQAAADTATRIALQDENNDARLAARRLGVTPRAVQERRNNRRSDVAVRMGH
jgi:hypothetical protein